jgi:hypothetical protein
VTSSEIRGGQNSKARSVSPVFLVIPLSSPFTPWVNIYLPPYDIPDRAAQRHMALGIISTTTCSLKREKQSFAHLNFQSFGRFLRKLDQNATPLEDTQPLYFFVS